jgi:hypothetical protein
MSTTVSHSRLPRLLLALVAALLTAAALATGAWAAPIEPEPAEPVPVSAPAPAPTSAPTFERTVTVRESDADVSTGYNLQYGDRVTLSASGSIWAGVWFTGRNGPQGWETYDCAEKFPLRCSRPFSLLKRIGTADPNHGYSYVGKGQDFRYYGLSGEGLSLRINDDEPGNGNGSFSVVVRIYRNA